ncbi:hypothetical protein ShirakiTB12_39310 [Priestia megaterium]|uniref:Uncharacterized protein n=1 Tax=Priestia megaterium TaxID=1404 RepID=A0AAX6BNU1_PRIMG|nr:hypothetical protein ShirakiTB12_39310 [Priestia megaterium]
MLHIKMFIHLSCDSSLYALFQVISTGIEFFIQIFYFLGGESLLVFKRAKELDWTYLT